MTMPSAACCRGYFGLAWRYSLTAGHQRALPVTTHMQAGVLAFSCQCAPQAGLQAKHGYVEAHTSAGTAVYQAVHAEASKQLGPGLATGATRELAYGDHGASAAVVPNALPALALASGESCHRCFRGLHNSRCSACADSGSCCSQSPCSSQSCRRYVLYCSSKQIHVSVFTALPGRIQGQCLIASLSTQLWFNRLPPV